MEVILKGREISEAVIHSLVARGVLARGADYHASLALIRDEGGQFVFQVAINPLPKE